MMNNSFDGTDDTIELSGPFNAGCVSISRWLTPEDTTKLRRGEPIVDKVGGQHGTIINAEE